MAQSHLWLATFDWFDAAPAQLQNVRLFRSLDGCDGRAYFDREPKPEGLAPQSRLTRLTQTLDIAGSSKGLDAPFHYVVATDVLPEFEVDMNAWYDTEHMPGLAAVPGTVRAQRFLDRSGSPRYHALYDLATQETFGSEAWVAVRGTAWSSRVRPAFRNTQRTMYTRVETIDARTGR